MSATPSTKRNPYVQVIPGFYTKIGGEIVCAACTSLYLNTGEALSPLVEKHRPAICVHCGARP